MSKKKLVFLKILYIFCLIISFFLCNKIIKIENLIIYFVCFFSFELLYNRLVLGSWKHVFMDIFSFFSLVYFAYSIMSLISYVLDNYKVRVYDIGINYTSLMNTGLLYLKIFIVFVLIMIILGYPKKNQSFEKLKWIKISFKYRPIADFIATICVLYFIYLFLRNGFGIFSHYIGSIRGLISSNFNNRYIYIYIVVYTYVNIINIFSKKKINGYDLYRILILIIFWLLSMFVDRRAIVFMLVMVTMTILGKLEKVKIKFIFLSFIAVILFLSMAFFREGYSLNKSKFNDVFYYSTGEFTLTNYVSVYYYNRVNNGYNLLNGLSYTHYTIAYLFPSFIFENKPQDLGMKFYKESKVNIAFGFNPVAEGLINFGMKSLYITPLILVFYIVIANFLGKKNYFIYVLMYGYSIDFMRGMFANCVFELLFFIIILKLFYKLLEVQE